MRNRKPFLTRSLLFTIGAGFALSALLMAGVSLFGLRELAATDARLSRVVSENTVKERLANNLRDLLRARANALLSIVVITDAIDKYDELEHFYRLGEAYRKNRLLLERQLVSPEEKAVLARIDLLHRENCPNEQQTVELGLQGYTFLAFDVLQKKGIPSQKALIDELDRMVAIQQTAIATASTQAQEAYNRTRWLMLILGAAAVALALVVGALVLQRTARLSRETERERTRFRTLFETNKDGILILDGTHFAQCNQTVLDMFRIESEADFLRMRLDDLGDVAEPDERTPRLQDHVLATYARGNDSFEWRCRRTDGSRFPASIDMYAMQLDGRKHIQCIIRDINSQKAAEEGLRTAHAEALAAAELKSQFVANVSHEIRTPMNGIVGMTRLLLGMELEPKQREFVEAIDNSAQSLMRIINDLLDFSKIEAGRLTLEDSIFNLPDVLHETVAINRPRIEDKGLEFQVVLPEGLPTWVRGDSLRLRQVLLNLLDNAIKFTEKGCIRLQVQGSREAGSNLYRFSVEDTGIGIAPDALPKIFDAFSQADGAISRTYGGTGLGLAICRQLSELMGGRLTVRSGVAQGSMFELTLPLVMAHRPALASVQKALAPQPAFFSARVLVAEDNPINQKLIQYMLENLGLSVSIVTDGRRAYDAIRAGGIDLVLMDCQMPDWDGLTTTRAVRQWEQTESAVHVPIVALTANAMAGFDLVCYEAGMDDYLIKPLDAQLLVACLQRWLPASCVVAPSPHEQKKSDTPKPRFGLAKVEDTCNGDPEKIREMLELFKTSTEEQLEKLADAVRLGDNPMVARMAHQIKGGCAYLETDAMCSLAATIENAAKRGDASQLVLLSEDMEAEFIALKNEIDQVLAGQAG
jgi:PAS domain S-box-containing protein